MPEVAPDFDAHFLSVLPQRLTTPSGFAAARDVHDAPSLAFRLLDGRAYRLTPQDGRIRIDAGDAADAVVALDERAWRDLVDETATPSGLFYRGLLQFPRGSAADLERWEPALRALHSGRPIFDPARVVLHDRHGAPLDATRAFTLDDPPEDLRHFLHEAGFLHVRGVFAPAEIAALVAVVETFQARAHPGDDRSWWAKRADGTQVLCRLVYLGLLAPEVAALSDDPRLRGLMALADEPLRAALDRSEGHSVVIKNPQIVEGLSDLPWHRDCGLGGHPLMCPTLNIGVQLDAATAESGRLLFVPGSWRGSCHRSDLDRAAVVGVDTEPGDCTVHFGDVMHAAPPPTGDGPGRRALYLTCMPERAFDVIPAGKSYNDTIRHRW